jgi:hypothetical protein
MVSRVWLMSCPFLRAHVVRPEIGCNSAACTPEAPERHAGKSETPAVTSAGLIRVSSASPPMRPAPMATVPKPTTVQRLMTRPR